jgi:hypothetical protein
MSDDTKSMLKTLAVVREEISSTKKDIAGAQANLEATIEWDILKTTKGHLKELEAEAEKLTKDIKRDALADFLLYDQKPNIPGLAVRVNHLLRYDLQQVTEWCKENAKALFRLDVGEFEKLARTIDVPGVEKYDDPQITITSDLSYYLEEK